MIILIHISIALFSIVFATYQLFSPSAGKFPVSYALIGATLVSGTYLTILNPSRLISTCLTGLVYVGIVTVATVYAHRKLASQNQ